MFNMAKYFIFMIFFISISMPVSEAIAYNDIEALKDHALSNVGHVVQIRTPPKRNAGPKHFINAIKKSLIQPAPKKKDSQIPNKILPHHVMPHDTCVLLDEFGKIIQFVCAIVAFSTLIIKKFKESPPRPWVIWMYDVSKQICSGLSAHFVGMLTATVVSGISKSGNSSPCSWYFVAYVTDTTFGAPIGIMLLRLSIWILIRIRFDEKGYFNGLPVTKTGYYGQEYKSVERIELTKQPVCKIWFFQMIQWVFFCVIPARFVCLGIVYSLRFHLIKIASAISTSKMFRSSPKLELIFVMLAGPLVMNSVQYLVQDYVLKDASAVGSFLKRSITRASMSVSKMANSPRHGPRGAEQDG